MLFDQAAMIRLCEVSLARLAGGSLAGLAEQAHEAVSGWGRAIHVARRKRPGNGAAPDDGLVTEASGALRVASHPPGGEVTMTHSFSELVIGGVLFAPFVAYTVAALGIFLALRPVLVGPHRLCQTVQPPVDCRAERLRDDPWRAHATFLRGRHYMGTLESQFGTAPHERAPTSVSINVPAPSLPPRPSSIRRRATANLQSTRSRLSS